MTAAAAWRGAFIERLKATGNVTLAASGAGVSRQHAYRTRNRNKAFRRLWDEALAGRGSTRRRGPTPRHGHQPRYLLRRRGRGDRESLLGHAAHLLAQGPPAGEIPRQRQDGALRRHGGHGRPQGHVRVRPAFRAARPARWPSSRPRKPSAKQRRQDERYWDEDSTAPDGAQSEEGRLYDDFFKPLIGELERTGFAAEAREHFDRTGRFFTPETTGSIGYAGYAASLQGQNDAWVTFHIRTDQVERRGAPARHRPREPRSPRLPVHG